MKKLLLIIALLCVTTPALAQNLTTVSAANIQDINGIKLANSSAGGAGQEMEPTIQAVPVARGSCSLNGLHNS